MRKFLITEQQAQAIAQYLVRQPYHEVVGLVQILQQLEPQEDHPESKPLPTSPEARDV